MPLHAWWKVFSAVSLLIQHQPLLCDGEQAIAQASGLHNNYPSPSSLCGENLSKETGTFNGLYYVFYESSTSQAHGANIPIILWLSGGPGCSGLVALLFENGPCSFNDETNKLSFNPYSWTGLAHVIYIDQPKGTGYSGVDVSPWSLSSAINDMHTFLHEFFHQHQDILTNDFYIFGESYAGHYVPELAANIVGSGGSLPKLKGIGIGNGVVSTAAWVNSVIPFSSDNDYGVDLLGSNTGTVQTFLEQFKTSLEDCNIDPGYLRGQGVRFACEKAIQALNNLDSQSLKGVCAELGRNMYDFRRRCHADDPLGLCYRFTRLQDLVNSKDVSAYFELVDNGQTLRERKLRRSSSPSGVHVLVYGGSADTVVNWISQDAWTTNLDWNNREEFRSAPFTERYFQGRPIGRVRTAHGLSFMKIYDAGHMVPHDQPAVSFEMVRSFLYDPPGVSMFS